jgi:N,N'-diacetyllegionaminate synthase
MSLNKTIIIAEAGVNHNGDLATAFQLVDAAFAAGVDYVKFQTFKAEKLVSAAAKKAEYQISNTGNAVESQLQMLKRLELSEADHDELINYCQSKGVRFFSTAFDLDSLGYLASLGLDMVKIPSGEITNLPYLRAAARLFKRVILSTGMSTIEEIAAALQVFLDAGIQREEIVILHCNTDYPTAMEDVNLKAMDHIKSTFHTAVGYSDHTTGIEVPIAAVALGASVIEKHFTLDRHMEGPDHKASLEPHELTAMVQSIRNIEAAISGSGHKAPGIAESKNRIVARKSIHLAKSLSEGAILTDADLLMKRPGDGISPMQIDKVIGRKLGRGMEVDQQLKWEDLQ